MVSLRNTSTMESTALVCLLLSGCGFAARYELTDSGMSIDFPYSYRVTTLKSPFVRVQGLNTGGSVIDILMVKDISLKDAIENYAWFMNASKRPVIKQGIRTLSGKKWAEIIGCDQINCYQQLILPHFRPGKSLSVFVQFKSDFSAAGQKEIGDIVNSIQIK